MYYNSRVKVHLTLNNVYIFVCVWRVQRYATYEIFRNTADSIWPDLRIFLQTWNYSLHIYRLILLLIQSRWMLMTHRPRFAWKPMPRLKNSPGCAPHPGMPVDREGICGIPAYPTTERVAILVVSADARGTHPVILLLKCRVDNCVWSCKVDERKNDWLNDWLIGWLNERINEQMTTSYYNLTYHLHKP